MEVFITNIYNYITSVQAYTWMLITVEVVIIGFCCSSIWSGYGRASRISSRIIKTYEH